ncbi:hypothetical protein JVX98_12905 [Ensifer sp. PDNC004]|uniref:hypothetical protein n=1 Tax=Ensifer sp. PDNC004 TaxID=2811423 RepID=UPI001966535E|nr:hypothetical protein [Ensifer sp. PDNC004]QRY69122.1 hypothetical protein JVX98_12905 [Ensifer sp. PDNC004]
MRKTVIVAAFVILSTNANAQGLFDFADPCKKAEGQFSDGVEAARAGADALIYKWDALTYPPAEIAPLYRDALIDSLAKSWLQSETSKPLIEMAKKNDPQFEPLKFFKESIYPQAVPLEQEREYIRLLFKADYAASIRPRLLEQRSKVEEEIQQKKGELDDSCKPTVVDQLLRATIGNVASAVDANFKAAENESGEVAKSVRALTGISLGDIQKYGIAGGPNSEFNKILGGQNSELRKIVEFLSFSTGVNIFNGGGFPQVVIPFDLPNIQLDFPDLPQFPPIQVDVPKIELPKVDLPEIKIEPPKIELPPIPTIKIDLF